MNSLASTQTERRARRSELAKIFWQHWQQYRDYLYRCCIKWMGNPTDAEDALSRAMLKAGEKVQKYAAVEITNFKAWLTSLTKNLCVDIHRERARGANRVENIEVYASSEGEELVSPDETPESALEADEKKIVIRRAIENLPPRLRETFIPHYYKDLSHLEIAQKQGISYQKVCKRISQARKILREELKAYFIDDDAPGTDSPVPLAATESAIEEKSQGNGGVELRMVPVAGRQVIFPNHTLEEQLVCADDAERILVYEVTKSTLPVSLYRGTVKLSEVSPGVTKVNYDSVFIPVGGKDRQQVPAEIEQIFKARFEWFKSKFNTKN
ncbi:sigma-70 family RNA polymerase sigma factor [Kamptonema formosum]|uniref:sigma-70 family RNA polymerase sigma factor n=1 Tax=Kamptonema formosum TaxID=331992 RepID=UPI00034A29D3|nr:sigma-70 family RNA polymerase sigma factor [Oscillatoria sp. PCC 10802]